MIVKSIDRTLPRLAAGIIVMCLSFAAIAGATTLADVTQISAKQATCWVAPPTSFARTGDNLLGCNGPGRRLTNQVTKDRFGHGVAWGDVNNDGSSTSSRTFADYVPWSS